MVAVFSVVGRSRVALAVVLAIGALTARAETAPSDAPVASASKRQADQPFASPAWRDLLTVLHEKALRPVDEDAMRAACLRLPAEPSSAGASPEDACLAAALEAADARAIYYSAQQTTERSESAQKAPVGIGLEVGAVRRPGDDLLIVSALSGGPGEHAGVLAGDLLVRIDGQDVRQMTTHQAMMRLRGEPGSEVSLELARGAGHEKISLVVHRARIRVKAVRREPGQGTTMALRIGRFDDGTFAELGDCVDELLRGTDPLPAALLVDLRADPGGSLDVVLQVASLFSERGDPAIGRVADKAGTRSLTPVAAQVGGLSPAARAWLSHVRLGVLVDHGTASGAELLTQFLRENNGARVYGSRTFGMAYIAQQLPLRSGASMLLPAGELASPRGISWESIGIAPDLEVAAIPRAEFGSQQDAQFLGAMQDLSKR